ncbi:uncharacterized protein LOC143027067, partial [Oratosquilla oratoria]|uniref:uncharacterized protein LOC143027067 n=1 Tax=Oratosquilla oratoria TaxID=337810 RepID=UPI003F774278
MSTQLSVVVGGQSDASSCCERVVHYGNKMLTKTNENKENLEFGYGVTENEEDEGNTVSDDGGEEEEEEQEEVEEEEAQEEEVEEQNEDADEDQIDECFDREEIQGPDGVDRVLYDDEGNEITFHFDKVYNFGERGSGLRPRGTVQDFYSLRDQCLESGDLFEDPDFQAEDSSIFFSRAP